jgi:hypothetical protein
MLEPLPNYLIRVAHLALNYSPIMDASHSTDGTETTIFDDNNGQPIIE